MASPWRYRLPEIAELVLGLEIVSRKELDLDRFFRYLFLQMNCIRKRPPTTPWPASVARSVARAGSGWPMTSSACSGSAGRAMHEAPGEVLQAPSASSERTPRRVSPSVPLRRTVGVVALAAVLFTLTVLAGPHLIEHLLGTGGDPDHCAVCVWTHGAGTSAPTAPPALVAALPIAGGLPTEHPLVVPTAPRLSSPSRAPPTIG
jgi:hypothetical protein